MTTVMGTSEALSDEELARRLQAEFLSEEFGNVEDEELMKTLADQLQRQQEDEAYAKKIQEEYDREAHVEPPYYSTYTSPGPLAHPSPNQFLFAPYPPASSQPHTKVQTSMPLRNKTDDWSPVARTISTQEKNLDSEKEEEDDEFQCLICYESPDEYIVLPMCKTPHIYCMECAERLYQQTNASRIQCPLCSVVTPVDSGRGLRGLRRKRKKAELNLESGMCPKHDKALYYFCFDCLDVLCVACTESHQPQHKLDTLSAAFTKCKQEVGEQLLELSDKKTKLEAYSRGLKGQVQQTKLNADEKHRELREQMVAIRAELDKKEEELSRAIDQMRDRKLAAIESEARWATDKLERVTKGTELAGRVVFSNTKLMSFFQELMKNEDEFLEIVGIPVKEIQPNTARLPQLPTRGLSNALQQLRYVENRGSVYDASPSTGNWDFYYDESSSEEDD